MEQIVVTFINEIANSWWIWLIAVSIVIRNVAKGISTAGDPIIRMRKGVVHDSYTIPEVDVSLIPGHTKGDEDV